MILSLHDHRNSRIDAFESLIYISELSLLGNSRLDYIRVAMTALIVGLALIAFIGYVEWRSCAPRRSRQSDVSSRVLCEGMGWGAGIGAYPSVCEHLCVCVINLEDSDLQIEETKGDVVTVLPPPSSPPPSLDQVSKCSADEWVNREIGHWCRWSVILFACGLGLALGNVTNRVLAYSERHHSGAVDHTVDDVCPEGF